jgi:hypothetical protein
MLLTLVVARPRQWQDWIGLMGIEPTRLALSRQHHQLLTTDVGSTCDWRVNGFTWESPAGPAIGDDPSILHHIVTRSFGSIHILSPDRTPNAS